MLFFRVRCGPLALARVATAARDEPVSTVSSEGPVSDDVDGIAGAALVGLAGARDAAGAPVAATWRGRPGPRARCSAPCYRSRSPTDEPPELEFGVPVADSSTSSLNV
jgi:hypothetical protein